MIIDILDGPKIDAYGFDEDGLHDETGTKYDLEGYNKDGYDKRGYDREGFNKKGWSKEFINKHTRDKYDLVGYDSQGFNKKGIHCETGTKYDVLGFDSEGFDSEGFDNRSFNKKGIHCETGTKYDRWGFDNQGRHKNTKMSRDENGFKRIDIMGFDVIQKLAKDQKLFFKEETIQVVDIVYDQSAKKYIVVGVDKMGDLLKIATSQRRSLAMSYLRKKTLTKLGYKYTPKGYLKKNQAK